MILPEKEEALKDFLHQFKCDIGEAQLARLVIMIDSFYIDNNDIPF